MHDGVSSSQRSPTKPPMYSQWKAEPSPATHAPTFLQVSTGLGAWLLQSANTRSSRLLWQRLRARREQLHYWSYSPTAAKASCATSSREHLL
jgi:hypothetical protein